MELARRGIQVADFSYAEMMDESSNECISVGILGGCEQQAVVILCSRPSSSSETREYVSGDLSFSLEVSSPVERYTQPVRCTPSLLSGDEYKKPSPN